MHILQDSPVNWIVAAFMGLGAAGCKPASTDSDTESLQATSRDWSTLKTTNHYLFSWPTSISKTESNLCWYYKEVPQNGPKLKLSDALRTAKTLQNFALSTKHLGNQFHSAIAISSSTAAALGLSSPAVCAESVAGGVIIATMPALTSAVMGPEVKAVALCALGISGIFAAKADFESNVEAHRSLGASGLTAKPPVPIDVKSLKRIKDVVMSVDGKYFSDDLCPNSQEIFQLFKKNNLLFPDIDG